MNANDLLDMIGDAKGEYIWQAQQHRTGTAAPKRKRLSVRKALLIAAVIVLALLLVGCTVAVIMSLDSLTLSEERHTDERTGETEVWNMLSLQGVVGSKNYQAAQEWYEFRQIDTAPYDEYETSREYAAYGCWSQEIKDKIDEICEKYSLELLGEPYNDSNVDRVFRILNIDGILNETAEMQADLDGGYYYRGGTFHIYGETTLTGENNPWPHTVEYGFRCVMKNVFDNVYLNIGDVNNYEQWPYTMKDGTQVLLALSERKALIIADKEEFFATVNITNPIFSNPFLEKSTMDKAALEAIAETFDFSFQPYSMSEQDIADAQAREKANLELWHAEQEELQKKYEASIGKESYAARVKYHLEQSSHPERLGYAFLDVDGNGVEELLIGADGYCIAVYTEVDGTTEQYANAANYLYPCENGILASVLEVETCDYYFVNYSTTENAVHIQYCPATLDEPEQWRFYTSWRESTCITQDEFNDILNSYTRIPVKMLPLTEYPLQEEIILDLNQSGESDGENQNYLDIVRMYLTHPEEQWYRWSYALCDLDGNGQEELIWQEDSRETVYTMTQGKLKSLLYGKDLTVCEDGFVEIISNYGPVNKAYRYYRIDGGRTTLVDYLRYDVDADPDNPWFRSPDLSCQDVSLAPISRAEFDAIRAKYTPMVLDMKPIAEFPLN